MRKHTNVLIHPRYNNVLLTNGEQIFSNLLALPI